ncbi:hypothetical protein CF319_g9123 [Tilletia indica]|nr:hypothetical protein CF319_g9123 [Tilletia indica]
MNYRLLPSNRARPSNSTIVVADGKKVKAPHRGNTNAIIDTANDQTKITLNDMLIAPGMAVNLLSITRLLKDGWMVIMWEPATVLLGPENQVVIAEMWTERQEQDTSS